MILCLVLACIAAVVTIRIRKGEEKNTAEPAPKQSKETFPKEMYFPEKLLIDEGEMQTIPVSVDPKGLLIENPDPSVCIARLTDDGIEVKAVSQGKVRLRLLLQNSPESKYHTCQVCVRRRLNLYMDLNADRTDGEVLSMTAYLQSDEDIEYHCQVLFNMNIGGKSRYFFANKGPDETWFRSNCREEIPHVAEELFKLRDRQDQIESLRLWVTNLKYDQERYHIVIKNRYKAGDYWWKQYDRQA